MICLVIGLAFAGLEKIGIITPSPVKEACEKWGLSNRWVNNMCHN